MGLRRYHAEVLKDVVGQELAFILSAVDVSILPTNVMALGVP
jgi:hypothetical protein